MSFELDDKHFPGTAPHSLPSMYLNPKYKFLIVKVLPKYCLVQESTDILKLVDI